MTMRKLAGVAAGAALALCVGCGTVEKSSNVQKGAAAGAAAGGVVGSSVGFGLGHTALGAVIGLPAGAALGALTAEHYFPDSAQDERTAQQIQELQTRVASSDQEVQQLRAALDQEEAQRQALIEASEAARAEAAAAPAAAAPAPEVKITIGSDALFESGKATLTTKGKSALAGVADQLRQQYPDATFEVRGHTDNVPIRYSSWHSNWELSCARATAVVQYLVESQGLPASRFTAVGKADTDPIASNDTPDGRKQNRRAEIVVRPQTPVAVSAAPVE